MISLITGESVLHENDFDFNSPVPFNWTRNYFSHVHRKTMWHFNYDQYVRIDRKEDSFFGRMTMETL